MHSRISGTQQHEPGGYAANPQNRANMTQREGIHKFENERIKQLQEERLHIQKKTFTKWMNSFLMKAKLEVEDLFVDLADGVKLLKLLEIISGEKLGKPNSGKMRVHKIENVNKSLAFLHTKVRLESIGAEDIVDGNPRLILGLIWTIILRFQIQEIEIDVDEENESSEKRSAKDALLLWCQRKTHGYNNVHITDFSGSWRSGLGFNALIHAHRPDLFDFATLVPGKNIDNLNHAFDVADSDLGIPSLLDAEDIDTQRPDEKSILTYVASYYHTFARMKNEQKSGKRIANIMGQLMDADKKKAHYVRLTTELLGWIKLKTIDLEKRDFPNSLDGIQKELLAFKLYRTIEKPPKYKDRSEIEALYFTINTLLKSLNQPQYTPQDGVLVNDIEKAWQKLENAEHMREVALREELLRQEKLEQLNYKFEKKSVLREGYLKEMIQVLSDARYGANLRQVDATVKKHEAISADILARVERFNDLTAMASELEEENYHGKDRVKKRESEVLIKWHELLELLENHKLNLSQMSALMNLLREIDTTLTTIKDLQTQFESEDVGPHLLGVEELLQAHSLQELQVTALGETQRRFQRQGQAYKQSDLKDAPILLQKLEELNSAHIRLIELSAERRARLEEARNFYHFLEDHDNEEGWLIDKQRICKTGITAKDLRAVLSLQQKHKALEDEMKVRKPKSSQLTEIGKDLISDKHPRHFEVQSRLESLQEHWKALEELVELRKRQLEDAAEAYQFYTDANEAESWLNEKMALVASDDYGVDEPSAQALLQRHRDMQGELNAYSGDILNLNQQAEKLIKAGICTLELSAEPDPIPEIEQEEWVNETRLVPKEIWEEVPTERIEHRQYTEPKLLPHVKASYPFDGQGMKMAKGDIMILQNKTNADWWSVRKPDGSEGFVPANYVREIDPILVPCVVSKPEKVKTIVKTKKTILVRQVVPVKRFKPTKVSQIKPLLKRRAPGDVTDSSDSVEKRQKRINTTYDHLQDLAQRRHALLEDSICLFGFYRECDDFERWITDKEKLLKTEDPTDNVETAKRKFEKFLTDLSASSKRIEALDVAVDDFTRQGHSQLDKVKARQKQIHQMWDHLNYLKAQKEKNLEGASSVELFNRTCEEAKDWMQEKMTQLDTAELGPDLKTVQALQRRHQNLERELAPLEEKVNRVNLLGNSVKSSYPSERANVTEQQREIQNMWQQVQDKAVERRSRLENAVGQQIFMNSARFLLAWVESVKLQLNTDETARDVETAENLLKKHNELGDEIKTQSDEFREVMALGNQILQRNPSIADVAEMIDRLKAEQDAIHRGWVEKQKWLQQCVELQIFNREADKIDATTKSHEAFLEYIELGNSLDDVEAILKRHSDFENSLTVQDKILKAFSNHADKLIANNHYDAKNIDDRRTLVFLKRQNVKDHAQARRQELQASKDYQKFVAEAGDLDTWLTDKMKIAGDESYRDLSNLPRKLQKHKAFERELRANEGQLRRINKDADALISTNNRPRDVEEELGNINRKWKDMITLSLEKGRRLEQAATQREHNRNIEDAKNKLDELDSAFQSKEVGNDLRSCKDLMNKYQILETDIALWEQKIAELVSTSDDMAQEGHFDSAKIQNETKIMQEKFGELKEPVAKRGIALEESLKFHKYVFELEAELQWINDHMPTASSDTIGQNLHQVQSLYKKHKKLEAEIEGHKPMIVKTLNSSNTLIEQNHPEKATVIELCDKLQNSWDDLQNKALERSKKLELSLKAQQYLSEAAEIESWLAERDNVLRSTDYGRDRDSATKLLTKHKATELELDTYSGIVSEMGHNASAMISANHPDSKTIAAKQQLIEKMFKSLQKLAAQRQRRLMESLYRHEYFLESTELEQWIKEEEQVAASEDYGLDYEHLLILQNKFDDLKHRVEIGSERYNQCEESAQKLIASEITYAADIERRQEQLGIVDTTLSEDIQDVATKHEFIRNAWENLLAHISQREQKLHAAGEIHRFHRDVAEALSRIQDKKAALLSELGKDLNSSLALLRKHEVFENDLVALEAQLQVLVEDSVKLQGKYPSNGDAIAKQQESVVEAWNSLKEETALRNDQLAASYDLQSFLTQVRDLMSWASNLRATLQAEERVRDATGAMALKIQHEAIYGEIEAREEKFRFLNELSDSMVQTGHYAATEVEEKCTALLDERQKLHAAWSKKKILLEQKIDLFCFLRDAKQIDNLSSSQEAALSSSDFGVTVENVNDLIKKHDAFDKLIQTQDEKVAILQDHARKLIEQNHYESPTIEMRLNEVLERRQKIKDMSIEHRNQLCDALLYVQFSRDCAEAESWISEKEKKLEADTNNFTDAVNLEDKIKKLQKHQAFQAEIAANEGRIKEIKGKGETLIAKRHEAHKEIKTTVHKVLNAWKALLKQLDERGRGLEEAQDILEFNNQLDKIEAWIRDKEMMIHANDTGRDLEHCNALRRKLDDVDSDMRVDDQRVKSINVLADKLLSQGQVPNETKVVQQRRNDFNGKWKALQGALNNYRDQLAGACEVHMFYRDAEDTSDRIAEKALLMSSDDLGKDLVAVEVLIRKQDALERDMTAIKQKITEHDKEAAELSKKYPDKADEIQDKLAEVHNLWDNLQELSLKRKQILRTAYSVHKFASDVKELELWVNDIIKKMNSSASPSTITESVSQIELHQERKAEIDGRDETFKQLRNHGESLVSSEKPRNIKSVDVDKSLQTLEMLHKLLHNAWADKHRYLQQAHQLQLFRAQADEIESWLGSKEAFLNNDDLGESYTAVEVLIKKHEAFEKLMNSNNVDELKIFAEKLLMEDPEKETVIKPRLISVLIRKEKLFESSELRRQKLLESLQFQQFLRNLYEVDRWLAQKAQIAFDENYTDSSNLQSKIQKHTAFDSELTANTSRVSAVIAEGEALADAKHYATEEILMQLELLETEWRKLQEASRNKKECLGQAYDALLFGRNLDEFNTWMDEMESQLSSEEYGKDLASVSNLLKKHEMIEVDVAHHLDTCEQVTETDTKFFTTNHFMKDEMHERAMTAVKRYHSLHEPTQIRRDNLEDSLLLHQFLRDAEDEIEWLNEKEMMASSTDLGNSLTAVQSLQKKHQALEAEISSQEPLISALIQRSQQMIRDGHFASENIGLRTTEIQMKMSNLRGLSSIRRLRLLDAVESQMFYAEANEAESWMKEKRPLVTTQDYGKDEDTVQSMQKKLEAFQRELVSFAVSVEKITKLATNLTDRGHFDNQNIINKNETIVQQYDELIMFANQREQKLIENKKLYEFMRGVEEVHEWIADQTTVAGSEEYGSDVEHVEQLITTFDSFISNLSANEGRVVACVAKGEALLADKNPNKKLIKTKTDETKQLWEELKDLVSARQEALAGAKQVHMYDRTADETITWINEKESRLMSEDYGQDLETIQALVRKQEVFDTEIVAVKVQVESVLEEATKLAEMYPDARDHIAVKKEDTIEAWSNLVEITAQRKEKLKQAEQLQTYFDEYRDLMSWINEMLAKITAAELAKDVPGAELLLTRTREHRTEIDSRHDAFVNFYVAGNKLIDEKHFLAHEVQDRISVLGQRQKLLETTWLKRKEIYDLNLDTQIFLREAEILESWIVSREPQLKDTKLGESIAQVEDLLRRHEDFEKTVAAQEDKFHALKRITKLEQEFRKQKEEEMAARRAERERIERERLEAMKQKEVQRITEERRRTEKQLDNTSNGIPDTPIFSSPVIKPTTVVMSPYQQHQSPVSLQLESPITNVQKSNSFVTLFGDKLRRGSEGNIKRAESMKIGPKQAKRTPSFTTRRRAQSFRKNQRSSESDFAAVEIQGLLERKNELQSGGKKAPVRSWKPFHTVLCGQLLCFFKDETDFFQRKAATAPVNIHNARCEKAENYTKRKYVFRLRLPDGSEFLFLAGSNDEMNDWIIKLSFHASLPPNLQLLSYDESVKQSNSSPDIKTISLEHTDISSVSSRTSSPDSQRRDSRQNSVESVNSTSTPQTNFLQKQKELREQQKMSPQSPSSSATQSPAVSPLPSDYHGLSDKPPIPPRGIPPPVPIRQISHEPSNVMLRQKSVEDEPVQNSNNNYGNHQHQQQQQQRPYSAQPNSNLNGSKEDVFRRKGELRSSEQTPPLPITQPPVRFIVPDEKITNWQGNTNNNNKHKNHHNVTSITGHHHNTTSQHQLQQMQQPQQQLHQLQQTQQQLQQQQQQQQYNDVGIGGGGGGGRTTWHQYLNDYTTTNNAAAMNYQMAGYSSDGWGNARYDNNRPTSMPQDGIIAARLSTESSSESESQSQSSLNSGKGGGKDKDKKGKFWPFSKKKGKNQEMEKKS